jgi:NAD+ synthase (glutamine-hydrolysing)
MGRTRPPSSSSGVIAAVVGGTDEPSGGTNVLTVVVGPALVEVVLLLVRGRTVVVGATVVGASTVVVVASVVVVVCSTVVVVVSIVVVVRSCADAGVAVTTRSAKANKAARIGGSLPRGRVGTVTPVHVVRVALCQVNTVVGDLEGNLERLLAHYAKAEEAGCDLAVFPELAITGYPPEDLLLRRGFVEANLSTLQRFASQTGRCAAVVGFVESARDLFNAAAVCASGSVQGTYRKRHLPNYAVFDEARYFAEAHGPTPLFEIAGTTVGVSICEDAWNPVGPIAWEAAGGAELHVSLNASPYYAGRWHERERMLATRAADAACTIVYVNQVGGQDELVFDGGSMVVAPTGEVVVQAPQFVEDTIVVDLQVEPAWRKRVLDPRGRASSDPLPVVHVSDDPQHGGVSPEYAPVVAPALDRCDEIYRALVLGTRDYVRKNGFTDVVLGLSGGIDSSLVTVIAADAIGPEHVHAVALPSRYSTEHSITDAEKLCANLGIELRTIEIEPAFAPMLDLLAPSFAGREPDITEENLQGRIRAALLMALANKFRSWLVLICGNKSELAVGYTTIYGVDMAGGFAVIKDVMKTLVYELAAHRNAIAGYDVIPASVLTKPPSAELAPGQRDDQNLPPYDVLDPIVEAYVEDDLTIEDLLQRGHDEAVVRRIARLIDVAEWKRRQAPIGVRVTDKAFGRDRRMPITNRFPG